MNSRGVKKMKPTSTGIAIAVCILLMCVAAMGQGIGPTGSAGTVVGTPAPALFVPDGAIDPTTGDLLLISNAWPNEPQALRRFHPDGTGAADFDLQRFEPCCPIQPTLVAVDQSGNIYTLEYQGEPKGFNLYKHAPSGEIDIDWGYGEGTAQSLTPLSSGTSGGGYAAGESTLNQPAGGGRLEYNFSSPVDLVARDDGSLLVLDQSARYVYLVDPQGHAVTQFIGKRVYYPVRPFRLLMDGAGYLYLFDYHGDSDINRAGMAGVFKFGPDGTFIQGWGEESNGINDPYRPTLDLVTMVIDGAGTMVVLGGDPTGMNHGEVLTYDRARGQQASRKNMQYLYGYDSGFMGMLGGLQGGFVLLEGRDFAVEVNSYTNDGRRRQQVIIKDLYPTGR